MELLIRAKLAAGCGGLEGIGGIVRRAPGRGAGGGEGAVAAEKEGGEWTCAWGCVGNVEGV